MITKMDIKIINITISISMNIKASRIMSIRHLMTTRRIININ